MISACCRSRSHLFQGKAGLTLARMDRKCALNVQIALSSFLQRCMLGGTFWCVHFHTSVMFFDIGCTCFVVHDLRVNRDAASLEALHDGVEGWDRMVVLFGFELLYQYNISRIVVGKHTVLVAAHCLDWVASKVIREQCCKR